MNSKKKLFIHIGTGKTATTALQVFFAKNRDVLQQMGISYPLHQNMPAQHQLSLSFKPNKVGSRRFMNNIKSYEEEWNNFSDKLEAETTLISSEYFFGTCKKTHIAKIRELTSSFDTTIIAYLRRQDQLFQSRYNQSIKGQTAKCHTFSKFVHSQKQCKLNDYLHKLDHWAEQFGEENLIIRPYEKGQFYNGNIFGDFLHHVFGLELTDEFTLLSKDPNVKLHRTALEYKRAVNHLSLTIDQKTALMSPLQEASAQLYKENRKSYQLLSPQEQLDIIQLYKPANEAVARKYLHRQDGQLFYDPLPDINENWQPYSELLEEDARYINEYIAEKWPKIHDIVACGVIKASNSSLPEVQKAIELLLPGLVVTNENCPTVKDQIDQLCISSRFKWRIVAHRIFAQLPGILQRSITALAKKIKQKKKVT